MEKYVKIKALATKKGRYTAKEREYITKLAAENGIFLNTLCPDCYKDAAIEICSILKPKAEEKSECNYELKEGVNMLMYARNGNTYRVCAATLTDASAEEWLANGLSKSFFSKLPK